MFKNIEDNYLYDKTRYKFTFTESSRKSISKCIVHCSSLASDYKLSPFTM